MKKKLVSTLLSVAMVSTMLMGCGGDDATTTEDSNTETTDDAAADDAAADDAEAGEETAEDTTASSEGGKVYYLNFKPEVASDWEALAASYTEQTGVEVKVVTAASGTYEETLMSEIAKEDAPTLFQINGPVGYQNWMQHTDNRYQYRNQTCRQFCQMSVPKSGHRCQR